jgi:hypothetical protein
MAPPPTPVVVAPPPPREEDRAYPRPRIDDDEPGRKRSLLSSQSRISLSSTLSRARRADHSLDRLIADETQCSWWAERRPPIVPSLRGMLASG